MICRYVTFPRFHITHVTLYLGRLHENFPVDRFVLNFYSSQIMSYLCQKCKNKIGVTDFVSEKKHVENYLNLKIQHGLQGFMVKNIECESKEANDVTG